MTEVGGQRPAGLDVDALLALRRPRHDLEQITTRLAAHLDAHDGYVAFSGGKDSTLTLWLTLHAEPNVPVVFFDSGFEFPETYAFIQQVSQAFGVHVQWIRSRYTTLELLAASRAWQHPGELNLNVPDLSEVLIGEPSRLAHAQHGAGEIWGVRAAESKGRAAAYMNALRRETAARCGGRDCCATTTWRRASHGGLIRRIDGTVAYGPIWNWSDADVWAHTRRHQLPVNPVYDKLRRLGAPDHFQRVSHVLDGGRLESGRVTWLRRGWPDLFEDLARVLPRVREFI